MFSLNGDSRRSPHALSYGAAQAMTRNSFILGTCVGVIVGLVGVAAAGPVSSNRSVEETLESAKGVRLDLGELTKTYGEIAVRSVSKRDGFPYIGKLYADGTISGQVGSRGAKDTGTWWVEADTFCSQWNNWENSKKHCVIVVRDGDILKMFYPNGKYSHKTFITKLGP